MAPLRFIFMGTAELACASLAALAQHPDFTVAAVVTQPDRPKGRDLKTAPSAVKLSAEARSLPVLQPERARDPAFIETLRGFRPDLIVVVAYGQILPPAILDLPRHGCLNVHTSLLPRHRGAAPIQWALLDADSQTGVTIMKMDPGLDTGPILSTVVTPIEPADNATTLHDRLARLGAALLVETIPNYIAGRLTPQAQPAEGATYARKITKEDGRIDWNLPARTLWHRVRGLTPWPGAFAFVPANPRPKLLKIWQAEPAPRSADAAPGEIIAADRSGIVVACGQDALRLQQVQLEGGRRLAPAEFLSGHPLSLHTRLPSALP